MSSRGTSTPPGGILSLEESARRARPLRRWRTLDRERTRDAVAGAVRAWEAAWGLGAPGAPRAAPSCSAWEDEPGGGAPAWRPVPRTPSGAWWAVDAGGPVLLGDLAPFAGPDLAGPHGFAGELAARAWEDLGARLGAALGGGPPDAATGAAEPGAHELRRWAGTLRIRVPCAQTQLHVLLGGDRVERFLSTLGERPRAAIAPPQGRLAAALPLLGARRLKLTVSLDPLELSVGALAGLRSGDVLCSSHPLDRAWTVCAENPGGAGSTKVCAAFVGRVGERVAVELLPVQRAPAGPVGAARPADERSARVRQGDTKAARREIA
jgi:hypothetical protein